MLMPEAAADLQHEPSRRQNDIRNFPEGSPRAAYTSLRLHAERFAQRLPAACCGHGFATLSRIGSAASCPGLLPARGALDSCAVHDVPRRSF